jgi:hypothetical protein
VLTPILDFSDFGQKQLPDRIFLIFPYWRSGTVPNLPKTEVLAVVSKRFLSKRHI